MNKAILFTGAFLLSTSVWAHEHGHAAEKAEAEPMKEKSMAVLLHESACLNCHTLTEPEEAKQQGPSFGPPYISIAKRYKGDDKAFDMLFDVVRHGSNPYGKHWKEESTGVAMPPMVAVSDENITKLLNWILALDEETAAAAEAELAAKAAQ